MYLIVGLGNPEQDYSNTRHNMGFNTINKIAKQYNIEIKQKKFTIWHSNFPLLPYIASEVWEDKILSSILQLASDHTQKAKRCLSLYPLHLHPCCAQE